MIFSQSTYNSKILLAPPKINKLNIVIIKETCQIY